MNEQLHFSLSPSVLFQLCFSALYSCKDVVTEHNHNNITGKTFIKLVFTVVYTSCKLYSLLPTPMPVLSLLQPSTILWYSPRKSWISVREKINLLFFMIFAEIYRMNVVG